MGGLADKRFELRLGEPGYPEQLIHAPDPPHVIYGIGNTWRGGLLGQAI
jgi:predicted Rossmann fold nucleotide-binding protein DprA/Smf involved in DNA uptake